MGKHAYIKTADEDAIEVTITFEGFVSGEPATGRIRVSTNADDGGLAERTGGYALDLAKGESFTVVVEESEAGQ
jgi:hypothetical protein